jgi:hypothetical protein
VLGYALAYLIIKFYGKEVETPEILEEMKKAKIIS